MTPEVSFELKADVLNTLLKRSAVMKLPDLSLIGKPGENLVLRVHDKKNPTNTSEKVVGISNGDFQFNFKIDNLKIIPGDYDIAVSSKSISHFKNKTKPVEYWIALEPDSKVNK